MREPPATWKGSTNLISTHQAEALMREHAVTWKQVRLPLEQAYGYILAENLLADRDGPPFHRVAMDGIAISQTEIAKNGRTFDIAGMQAAGDPQKSKSREQTCFEVMTGAVLPEHCDAVVQLEKCEKVDDIRYKIHDEVQFKPMLNIHQKGCDFKQGDSLLHPSQKLRANEIAVAASLGCTQPLVYQTPSIGIITTGSELVDVADTPLPHQIRKSNIHAASASLNHFGFNHVEHYHIPDNYEDTVSRLGCCLEKHDILILSGGVSKGKFDFIPNALSNLGVKKHFHCIAQKPGKPMWFGTKTDKCVYALPGNPVSLLVCLRRYVIPNLLSSIQKDIALPKFIPLGENFKAKERLSLLSSVMLRSSCTSPASAYRVVQHGSGDYASLTHSDGFIELTPSDQMYKAGTLVPFYDWEQL